MRLKPIKPGMVIHCKNDTEYEQLNAEVIKLGYGRLPFEKRNLLGQVNNVVFCLGTDEICWNYVGDFNGEYIEFSHLIIPELSAEEKAYNKGLNDAWELAKKIALYPENGGLSREKMLEIFNNASSVSILTTAIPQEVLAKIEAYKKEQAEIKVGDVVSHDGLKGVVTRITDDCIYTISYIGTTPRYSATESKKLTKTGKRIDISAILAEIGKE